MTAICHNFVTFFDENVVRFLKKHVSPIEFRLGNSPERERERGNSPTKNLGECVKDRVERLMRLEKGKNRY